jgi:hypothetical protein
MTLAIFGICCAQTASSPPQSSSPTGSRAASDGLKDLDAMTFACPRAALNAAARVAAKVPAQGTYQFAYFRIVTGSHHARYEVHFASNYEGEQELKYCVALYCQQGWDPGAAETSVTLMSATPQASSAAAASRMGSCAASPSSGKKRTTRPPS